MDNKYNFCGEIAIKAITTKGSAMQQNHLQDYIIFAILLRLHQDYAWTTTPGLHLVCTGRLLKITDLY